jgi:hypothetical protein
MPPVAISDDTKIEEGISEKPRLLLLAIELVVTGCTYNTNICLL